MTQILKLSIPLVLFSVVLFSCDSSKIKAGDSFETITHNGWDNINDTNNAVKPIIAIPNIPGAAKTVIDWGESVQLLFFPEKYIKSKVLLQQNNYPDTVFSEPSQKCVHEEDTVSFKQVIDSALQNSFISQNNKKKVSDTLVRMYFNAGFFRNYSKNGDTTFHIIENGVEHFVRFEGRLNYTGALDKICEGKLSLTNGNTVTTFSQQIFIANLAFSVTFKEYMVSNEPVNGFSGIKINHKQWPGKNVYYKTYAASQVAADFGKRKPVRKHKLLMATN
jgi:hypothetical protein